MAERRVSARRGLRFSTGMLDVRWRWCCREPLPPAPPSFCDDASTLVDGMLMDVVDAADAVASVWPADALKLLYRKSSYANKLIIECRLCA